MRQIIDSVRTYACFWDKYVQVLREYFLHHNKRTYVSTFAKDIP